MIKKISRYYRVLITAFFLFPLAVHAAGETALPNYVGVNDIPHFAGILIKGWFLGSAGVFALIFFVWGGFDWIMSEGDAEKIKVGKDKMIWATMGILAILLSYAFVNGFLQFVFGI